MAKRKSTTDELFDRLRAGGLRKRAARDISAALNAAEKGGGAARGAGAKAFEDLRALVADLETRVTGGSRSRSAAGRKAAATRKRKTAQRSAAARKGAAKRAGGSAARGARSTARRTAGRASSSRSKSSSSRSRSSGSRSGGSRGRS